jgi:hypothetical protein
VRALPPPLRKQLAASVLAARRAAESASRAVMEGLGVFQREKPAHLDADQAALRVGLRQKWRQLGGDEPAKPLLVGECAYEQWHRLLFARFLAENDLLLHPQYKAPVTLADCDELAAELGEPDGWSVAARFAAEILPGIFRLDDPCLRLRLAPEGRHALEQILDGLPVEAFKADDALGWVYQFWQKDKKAEVDASGRKIGGADIGPVTQLFTENYMVRFLLENSLGAWWAARHPESPLVKEFDYLRFDDDGTPAAGTFDGWPDRVAEVTVMDPCCGSGHFLVEAFTMLSQMRAEEEGLSPVDAQDAVLRDNLFGLEIDPRCVQIAMFAVALQAWKAGGGWRQLPVPNIGCSGVPVKASSEEWTALAERDQRLEKTIARLHTLFRNADSLGSLIDPRLETEDDHRGQWMLDSVAFEEVQPLIERALTAEGSDVATRVLGYGVGSVARAALLLSRRYTLVSTNVPYLHSQFQSGELRGYLASRFPLSKADIATAFVERIGALLEGGGTSVTVTPQNWTFLSGYRKFRQRLLETTQLQLIVALGAGAFGAIPGEVVQPVLTIQTKARPSEDAGMLLLGVREQPIAAKASQLADAPFVDFTQLSQLLNPDAVITFSTAAEGDLLSELADGLVGIQTGDNPRFVRSLWEIPAIGGGWALLQGTPSGGAPFDGRSQVLFWEEGAGEFIAFVRRQLGAGRESAWIRGRQAWGRLGVVLSRAGDLPAAIYTGELFLDSAAVILPTRTSDLPSVYAFCRSPEYSTAVRRINKKVVVTNKTLVKVPFDVDRWRRVAKEGGPLPEPWSDDPTQWLFEGRPEASTAPLHVALARLVGYRWPEQADNHDLDAFVDSDGIVCLPPVAGEPPAADRVQQVLAAAFGDAWSPANVKELLKETGTKKKTLADWLCDDFFKQHCTLFGNRPFVWHIWDGLKNGFSALVNYHRLDRPMLEKLTYTYLGQDWVERQRAQARDEVAGAEARLAAALELRRKLELILEGEAPYDVYVRWKELHEQPVGWEPDLNDGVRLNIRPFVEAGVLRSPFNIHWKKDRGKNPGGTERHNDRHLNLAEKLEARRKAGRV